MKLRRFFPMATVGFGLFGAAIAAEGCSSSSSGTSTSSSSVGAVPPSSPAGAAAATTGTPRTFAFSQIFLGSTDRMGVASDTAWQSYGYNLDGKTTTSTSKDVCTQVEDSQSIEQVDGNDGIDNSFGENVLPIITQVDSTAESSLNNALTSGTFTIMLDIQGLTDDANQTNTGLSGQIFAGGVYSTDGTAPTFDLNTDWPVRPELLKDGATVAGGSKVQFSGASTYVNNGTFVANAGTISLSLTLGGVSLNIDINNAIITFNHLSTDPHTAGNGTIAGIIDANQLVTALQPIAGRLEPSLCKGAALMEIDSQILQASDIMSDGTNPVGQTCSGISIGIGFTAKEIKHPTKVGAPTAATPDPCTTDGGVADGG